MSREIEVGLDGGREIGPDHPQDFGMFTDSGNRAVAAMVDEAVEELAALAEKGLAKTDKGLNAWFALSMNAISLTKGDDGEPMSEVRDTDVRDRIFWAVKRRANRELDI